MAGYANLPADATSDDISDQIILVQTLIHSLDEEADDYAVERHGLQEDFVTLNARLETLSSIPVNDRPITPPSPSDRFLQQTSSRSINLPSRDRNINGNRPSNIVSPLGYRASPNFAFACPDQPTRSGAGNSNNKRNRDSLIVESAYDAHKKRRGSATPSLSSSSVSTPSGTPASMDSLDRIEKEIERNHLNKPPPTNVLKMYEEREAQARQRHQEQQRDRELASRLSLQGPSYAMFGNSFMGRPKYQSTFGPGGQLHRQVATEAESSNQQRHNVKHEQDTSAYIKSERRGAIQPHSHPTYNRGLTSHQMTPGSSSKTAIAIDDSDDDEVQLVGQFHRPGAPKPYSRAIPDQRRMNPFDPLADFSFDLPGQSQPGPSTQPYNSYQPNYPWSGPSAIANPMAGGSSVYNGVMNQLQNFGQSVGQFGQQALHVLGNLANPIDLDYAYLKPPSAITSLEERLEQRGLGSMLNDPARSREDLEALIENIRPDEDIPPEMRIGTPDELSIALMEHQKLGLAWLQKQEDSQAKGGILADDMGLGKTIQALALIATRRSTNPARKTTLIVAPVALLRQWKAEIEDKIKPRYRLTCYIYHGQKKKNDNFAHWSSYDIVLTTFGKLAAEHKRKEAFLVRKEADRNARSRTSEELLLLDPGSKWYRVIIDEAQNIKNHAAKSALGALHLDARYRLVMTGTPMMNNVGELFSLIRFLRIAPYNDQTKFNQTFKKPMESMGETRRNSAMRTLQALLKSIMLRRTKTSQIDGKPILNLPPRTTQVTHAVFDTDQENFYRALETQTQIAVNRFLQPGKRLKNYSYILVRLLRLRQACDHPRLIKDFAEEAYAEIEPEQMEDLARKLEPGVIQRIKDAGGCFECPICYDVVDNPSIFFPCGHDCCPDCFARVTDSSLNEEGGRTGKCPECRAPLDTKAIIDYRCFRRVHLPDEPREDNLDDLVAKLEDMEDEDSSSDEDIDSDSDADSQGDLRDFIVRESDLDEDDAEIPSKDEEDRADDELTGSSSKPKMSAKAKGKLPVKAKSKSKNRQSELIGAPDDKFKGKKVKMSRGKNLVEMRKEGMKNAKAKRKYLKQLRKNFETSAKIEKTIEVIRDVHANDPREKIIVFSQFTSFLDLLEIGFEDNDWLYRRYDGGMKANDRNNSVLEFQDKKMNVKVMLVSLKAGNAGLNLTAASQVIILDPFWNPFIEEQAIDRAHRIGQTKPVVVHRILIENTVEDRIIALQEKKRDMINTALDENASRTLSRLGRRELRYLFGLDQRPPALGDADD